MQSRDDNEVFNVLADPTRRAILAFVRQKQDPTAGEIADNFPDLGRTAVSSHLRLLRLAHLLEERREGRYRRYSLSPNRLDAVVRFLAGVYQGSLDDLHSSIIEGRTKAEREMGETGSA